MEEIWRWAEGNVKEVTARVKTCWECTAYVDIDGEQPRCGLDRDPFKCDRKMGGYENGRKEVTKMLKH